MSRILKPEQMGHSSRVLAALGIEPQQPGEDSLEAQQRIDREVAAVPLAEAKLINDRLFRS